MLSFSRSHRIGSQPGEKRNAVQISRICEELDQEGWNLIEIHGVQISRIREELNCVMRFPMRCWEIVTVLCKFAAQGVRIVDVIGDTVTVDK